MTATRRLRLVVTAEYDADPRDYGTDDPAAMAAIDAGNFEHDDPRTVFRDYFMSDDVTLTVEVVNAD